MRYTPQFPLPWLRMTMAALLAAVAFAGARYWINNRLAAVSIERAVAGDSLAVVALQSDWPRSVVPAALSAPGQAGERARNLANARLDLATGQFLVGEPETFYAVADGVLAAIRDNHVPITPPGAAWARWMATRLLQTSKSLDTPDRLRLLTLVDETLDSLPRQPRVRTPRRLRGPIESAVVAPAVVPPPPEPTLVEAPRPDPEPLTLREAVPPPADEPKPWQPDWSAPPAKPVLPRGAERVAHVDPPITALPDRILLARLLEASQEVGSASVPEAAISGPTSARRAGPAEATKREARRELLRAELERRGYHAIGAAQIEAFLSPILSDRVALAERLLVDRTPNTTRLRLLMQLANDASAEVREAAISVLGSTSDPSVVRAAFDFAVRDRDPRVGRLASALRERLR